MQRFRIYLIAHLLVFVATTFHVTSTSGDTFGTGINAFDIEFVYVGGIRNPDDTTGIPNRVGKVGYEYRIGKFEISEGQINKANAIAGLGIQHNNRGANKPATNMSWFEAASFVNWLNTSTGHQPAYKFVAGNFQLWSPSDLGYNPQNPFRNTNTRYFLPSIDEWYKAAYYDQANNVYYDYPTGSNTPPLPVLSGTAQGTAVSGHPRPAVYADVFLAGGLSPYGTMGQGGNVSEWQEGAIDLVNNDPFDVRATRGGSATSFMNTMRSDRWGIGNLPQNDVTTVGFRVASYIPEPTSLVLLSMGLIGMVSRRRLDFLRN